MFLYGQRAGLIKEHRNYDDAVTSAYERYARFKGLQEHSVEFYKFCIYHGLIHRWKFNGLPQLNSLRYLRKYLDIDFGGIIFWDVPFYEEEMVNEPILDKIRPSIKILSDLMRNSGFGSSHEKDSIKAPLFIDPINGDTLGLDYWRNFIPVADSARNVTSDNLEWIYAAEDFDPTGDFNLTKATDFSSREAFSDRHFEFHEYSFAQGIIGVYPGWDSLGQFLKDRWEAFENIVIDPEKYRSPTTFSVVNLYGFEINLIFLLYLIGPLIAGLFVYEYFFIRQLSQIKDSQQKRDSCFLFNYDYLFKEAIAGKAIAGSLKWAEAVLRFTGMAIILYGCLFRYSYIDYNNIPVNFFMIDHKQFEILDIVNLGSFVIAAIIYSQNSFLQTPTLRKISDNKWMKVVTWIGMIVLPSVIMLLTYVHSFRFAKNYYSVYALLYFLLFLSLLAVLFISHIRRKSPIYLFSIIALAFIYWNFWVLIAIILDW